MVGVGVGVVGPHVPVAPAMASEVGLHEVVLAETDQAVVDVPQVVDHDDHVKVYVGDVLVAATN